MSAPASFLRRLARGLPAAAALALLLATTGCQTLPPKERLTRAVAALEHPAAAPHQSAAAWRDYRHAVATVLADAKEAGDVPDLKRPARGLPRLWHLLRPTPRIASLHRDGVGLPVIERLPADSPNAPRGGYHVARTVLARPGPPDSPAVALNIVDPDRVPETTFGATKLPVAMDLQAPLDVTRGLGPRPLDGFRYLLLTNRFSDPRLIFLEPYDSDKIPVVFIHGLLSTPRMWGPVVTALLANETIRQRYQFWFFYYPTGQPIPLSALQLRDALDAAVRTHHVRQPLVLIGHSMGGLLARAQITGFTPAAAAQIVPGVASLPADNPVRRALLFAPRPDIARAIFIATPHRGSHFALNGIAGLGVRLIRLPLWLQDELASIAELPFTDHSRRFPTSICGLSPNSSFLRALDAAPTTVPQHSIIANRGQSDLLRSSDGIVPYTSAHRAEAVSEVIVPAGHGGFSHPLALAEIERILLKDATPAAR